MIVAILSKILMPNYVIVMDKKDSLNMCVCFVLLACIHILAVLNWPLSISLSLYIYIYMYILRERDKER